MSTAVEIEETIEEPQTAPGLALIVAESGIEKTKAQTVLASFSAFFDQADEWERKTKGLVITNVSQTREMKLAREGRLQLKEIRVSAEKTRKKLKENIVVEGRFIDSIYNLIEGVTKPLEADLLEKEQFVERQEAARIEALRSARAEEIALYGVDTSFYDLGNMPEASFIQLLENSQLAAEAKILAQRKAEEDRIAAEKAEQEERARVTTENERLKKEAGAREAEIAAERVKADEERKARDDAARAEQEEASRKLREAQEEADRVKRELQAKKDAEAQALREEAARLESERLARLEAEHKAAQAGDSEKVLAYVAALEDVQKPSVASSEAQAILDGCATIFARARTAAERLA